MQSHLQHYIAASAEITLTAREDLSRLMLRGQLPVGKPTLAQSVLEELWQRLAFRQAQEFDAKTRRSPEQKVFFCP